MDKSARFPALVGSIYDAALDPSLWPDVLGQVRDFVGGAAAGIVAKDLSANRGLVHYDDGGFDPDYTEAYFRDYVTLDPCTTGHFFSSVDTPVSTADLIPRSAFVETRFHREWMKPQGFVDYIAAAIDKASTTATVFNVMRRRHDGLIDEDARHAMRLVAPHVQRALRIGNLAGRQAATAASLTDTFDGLSAGVFLVTGSGQIVLANAAGQAMLAEGDPLTASGGRLATRNPATSRLLTEAFGAAGDGDIAISARGIGVPLSTRDGRDYVAHVLSLTSGVRREAAHAYAAAAAVFVREATLDVTTPPEAIARRYRLTPAELRVFLGIVEVGGVPEVADSLGVSETTIKTHLGNLFEKTGAGRQADLVKLFAGFANPLVGQRRIGP